MHGRQRETVTEGGTYVEYQEPLNSVNAITKDPFVAARERV